MLHPAASHEVRRVSCLRPPEPGPARSADRLGAAGHFPRRVSHPSKNSPRLQPFHIAVAVAPLPFRPSCSAPSPGPVSGSRSRCSAGRRVDFEAFLRCRVSSAVTTVAGRGAPCPSVGFVPLQGSFSESGAPLPRSSRRVFRWSPKRPAMPDELRSISPHARARRGPGPPPRGDEGLAPTIDCCFHSRRPEVDAVDPIPPQVRSLQSLSGAEVVVPAPARDPVARFAFGSATPTFMGFLTSKSSPRTVFLGRRPVRGCRLAAEPVRLAFEVSRGRKTIRSGGRPICIGRSGRRLPWSSPGLQGLARGRGR